MRYRILLFISIILISSCEKRTEMAFEKTLIIFPINITRIENITNNKYEPEIHFSIRFSDSVPDCASGIISRLDGSRNVSKPHGIEIDQDSIHFVTISGASAKCFKVPLLSPPPPSTLVVAELPSHGIRIELSGPIDRESDLWKLIENAQIQNPK